MILQEKLETNIELALASNRYCQVGILYSSRIFADYRNGSLELLVLLETGRVSDVWGHVAFLHQKWTSSILCVEAYFGGNENKEIIDDFWTNIDERAGFNFALLKGQDVIYSTSFNESAETLIQMIKSYYPEDEGNDSFAICNVYGMSSLIGDISDPHIRRHPVRGPGSCVRNI